MDETRSSSAKRVLQSPSGHTPQSKRQAPAGKVSARSVRKPLFELPQRKSEAQAWSVPEITRLHDLASSNPCRSHQFFKECAELLSQEFSTLRTGAGCSAKFYNTKGRATAVKKDASSAQKPLHVKADKRSIQPKVPWSAEELARLHELMKNVRNRTMLFFKECAAKLSEEFPTRRTGASCASRYYDTKTRTMYTKRKSTTSSSSCASHQTTARIPLSAVKFGKQSREPSAVAQKLHTYSTHEDAERLLSEEEASLLRAALDTKTLAGVARQLMDIPSLRVALWEGFLLQMREVSNEMCKQDGSILQRKKYSDFKGLSWDTVVDELISRNHLLLDTLLAYTVPLQKQHSGTIFEQLPAVLGMVYATIMKCRWKKLSLIQHVISLTLVEEKVHQKVFLSFTCTITLPVQPAS